MKIPYIKPICHLGVFTFLILALLSPLTHGKKHHHKASSKNNAIVAGTAIGVTGVC